MLSERGLKVHVTKSHLQDRDGFAVVVGGVPCVSRNNVVTSYNSHFKLNAMAATQVFCCE